MNICKNKPKQFNKIYLCTGPEDQGSTFRPLHTAMLFFPLVEPLTDTGRISLN